MAEVSGEACVVGGLGKARAVLVLDGCDAGGERYCNCWGVVGLLDCEVFPLGRLDGRWDDCGEFADLYDSPAGECCV